MRQEAPSERTRARRMADRARYDRPSVHSILDEGLIAHVAVGTPEGPLALPMAYGRIDDTLYVHGAAANAMLRNAADAEMAATVTLIDGLVLARSAFHHSMNYRSVVVRGRGRTVDDPAEKEVALDAIVNHATPGRAQLVRRPTLNELRATHVIALDLHESSAKVRTGPPIEDEADYSWPVWAGVVPLVISRGTPIPDEAPPVRTRDGLWP